MEGTRANRGWGDRGAHGEWRTGVIMTPREKNAVVFAVSPLAEHLQQPVFFEACGLLVLLATICKIKTKKVQKESVQCFLSTKVKVAWRSSLRKNSCGGGLAGLAGDKCSNASTYKKSKQIKNTGSVCWLFRILWRANLES